MIQPRSLSTRNPAPLEVPEPPSKNIESAIVKVALCEIVEECDKLIVSPKRICSGSIIDMSTIRNKNNSQSTHYILTCEHLITNVSTVDGQSTFESVVKGKTIFLIGGMVINYSHICKVNI